MATADPNAPSNFWTLPGPPGFDQVNGDYQTYLGRPLTQAEYDQYWANKTNYTSNDVAGTPEAVAYNTSKGNPGPIPTNPDTGAQIGAGLPWENGAPVGTVPGYHWDARLAMWQPGDPPGAPAAPDTPPPTTGTQAPTGGGGNTVAPSTPGASWNAPTGLPATGFGAAPPTYQSDPNAPTFQPLPEYKAPTWTGGDFVNPSEADLIASPGYQSRLDALMRGKTRQAAAQGVILSGGTLRALDQAGQDYASNEYQTFRNNALDAYKQKYSQFTDAAGMDLNARTINANQNQATFANRTQTYNTNNARTLSDYLTNVSAQRNAELDYWNRLTDVNTTGANLAGSSYKAP